jgi:two-component system sensor histidine kinase BaeS
MRIWRRVGLQGRLALALASVAVVAVVLATVLANAGLHSSLNRFAHEQLNTAAVRSAQLAAALYRAQGRGTPATAAQLAQREGMNGYRLALTDAGGAHVGPSVGLLQPQASAQITVDGRAVGTVTVAAAAGAEEAAEDRSLHDRLSRQHRLAGGLALALGLLVAAVMAPALARPLRRITDEARTMARGELQTRVAPSGAPELRELGHALNRLAETLEHEERIRRDAAADIAHELRTPLSGIVSRIEAAQDGVLADEQANLEALHTEALRLTRLVEDLGKLAEAQQPGLTLRKELLDMRELVRERAVVHRDAFQAKGIRLTEKLEEGHVYGDRVRIVKIVDNLLSNALRYTDAGGTVTIVLRERSGETLLDVADTGIGIRSEDLANIFERFWRGEPSRARHTGGAGIGLAIVRELVRAHGGQIDVESTPGEGSRFRVTLPSSPPAP